MSHRIRFAFLSTLLYLFLLQSCAQQVEQAVSSEPDMAAIRAQVEQMEANYAAALNAKDVEGVLAYYADDAVSFPDNEPARVGKESIREAIAAELARDTSQFTQKFETMEVFATGDYAVETGHYIVSDPSGKEVAKGTFMTLFEKRDGQYIAIRDIWNSDLPRNSEVKTEPEKEKM